MGSLARRYAERFCEEYDSPNIQPRKRSLTFQSGNHSVSLHNGEFAFGPTEVWPAQIQSYASFVSTHHSFRKPDYETLKNILLLEQPQIAKRAYISQKEYLNTIARLFEATLQGIRAGKLERVSKRSESTLMERIFSFSQRKKKIPPVLKNLMQDFNRQNIYHLTISS